MVDSVGLYAGMKPLKNLKEMNYQDMTPPMGIFVTKNNNVKNHVPGYFTPPSKPPSEFNDTIFRSSMKQVLPLKSEANSVIYGRNELPKNDYMYPNQGYARGQPLGLATDHNKPTNTPIMGITGFYDINMVNVLGGLPG
jgi:hypothetical protein